MDLILVNVLQEMYVTKHEGKDSASSVKEDDRVGNHLNGGSQGWHRLMLPVGHTKKSWVPEGLVEARAGGHKYHSSHLNWFLLGFIQNQYGR